jgi:hypothetical protein
MAKSRKDSKGRVLRTETEAVWELKKMVECPHPFNMNLTCNTINVIIREKVKRWALWNI